MKVFLACLLSALLLSCTAGRKLDVGQIRNHVRLNQTTKEEILRICGPPNNKRVSANENREIWHYVYLKKQVTGLGVLSHIAGIGVETHSHKVLFDVVFVDDRVVDYSIDEGSLKQMHFN